MVTAVLTETAAVEFRLLGREERLVPKAPNLRASFEIVLIWERIVSPKQMKTLVKKTRYQSNYFPV